MNGEEPSLVRGRVTISPFEAWIAVAAVYAGLAHFLPLLPPTGPARAVDARFPGLVDLWSVLYSFGGAAILIGLLRRSPRIEGLGLNLLGSGLAVSFIAALASGAAVLPTVVVSAGVILACICRLISLRRLT